MIDHVAPVIVVCKDVFCWINENFDLVSHLNFEANECHVQLVVEDHADLFELKSLELFVLKRHPIQLILNAREVVELPLADLLEVTQHLFYLLINVVLDILCVLRVRVPTPARTCIVVEVLFSGVNIFNQFIAAIFNFMQPGRVTGDEGPDNGN